MKKFAVPFRCCNVVLKITRYLLVNPASVKPPSSKVWRSDYQWLSAGRIERLPRTGAGYGRVVAGRNIAVSLKNV
ncbi:hypothetical protein ACLK19_17340 [Escherichia coli]